MMPPWTCPVWEDGRVTACFRGTSLGLLVPALACLVSFFISIYHFARQVFDARQSHKYRHLATARPDQAFHHDELQGEDDDEDEAEDASHIVRTVPKPRYITRNGPWITLIEGTGIIVDIVLGVLLGLFNIPTDEPQFQLWQYGASILFSAYLFILLALRTWTSSANPTCFSRSWSHSTALYFIQWVCLLVSVHAALIAQTWTQAWLQVTFTRFSIFSILVLLHVLAPRAPVDPIESREERLSISSGPAKTETASLASRLTFSWIGELVWRGYRDAIELRHLPNLARDQKSVTVSPSFTAATAASSSLVWRLMWFFRNDLLLQGLWAVAMSVVVFLPPFLLRFIIRYLQYPDMVRQSTAWLCVFGFFIAGILTGLTETQCEWIGRKVSAKLRAILISEIYAKVLRRKMTVRHGHESNGDDEGKEDYVSDGNILNLMAVDTTKISEVGAYIHLLWVTVPLQLAIATWMLYSILGISGVAGVVLMICLLPLNILLAKRQGEVQGEVLGAADVRVQASRELMSNIRIVKFCAWEKAFMARILGLRRNELLKLRWKYIWWSLTMTVWYCIPLVITIAALFFYTIVFKNTLENAVAFPALAVFAVLRMPLDRVSDMISFVLQAHVSAGRIDKFLREGETDKHSQLSESDRPSISFEDATLQWPSGKKKVDEPYSDESTPSTPDEHHFRLSNLQIDFQLEGLNIIFGPSGSGKSSLLLALLGEMELLHGRVVVSHHQDQAYHPGSLSATTAYCSQEPWIQNRTIMANITFGLPLDSRRYKMVTDAVALTQDLAVLDKGDQTLAGEKGNRLSGGQKQRVALARALYSRARLVILDDCLSAVDSRTAKHIFFQAIKGPLMTGRTCILATHHTRLTLPHCNYAVCLDNGRVKGQGTPDSLLVSGVVSTDILHENTDESLATESGPSSGHVETESQRRDSLTHPVDVEGPTEEAQRDYEEDKSVGAVSWGVVKSYVTSMGPILYWAVVLVAFGGQQVASLGTNLWIKEWAHRSEIAQQDPSQDRPDAGCYLGIYGAICVGFVAVSFFRDAVTFYGALGASAKIQEGLLKSVLNAKLTFFDRTPLGQIINRFSKDIEAMDQELAPYAISTFHIASTLIMVIILISTVLPAFLIVAAIICLAYYAIGAVYINASRDLKRIESVERSPLYQLFGESLSGYVSIRAYHRTGSFMVQNHGLVDSYNRPHILLWASKEWLSFRINCMSALISCLTGVFVLWESGTIDPGAAGLVLTYASTLTENVFYLVQLYSEVQQSLNSIERIIEYNHVEQEAAQPLKPGPVPPSVWPQKGGIKFQQYTVRYAPGLDPALKAIDFEVRAGQRVAVVGRTGAGKSTLALALIRGLEAENGSIELDGIDIASISLEQLRQAVTVVPQDPSIFNGSLRENLDPLYHYTDEELQAALRNVYLAEMLPGTDLDAPIQGLSLGQRQLLCIARALVRQSRVLVLDEATASIDHDTDALIQKTLRSATDASTTLLTIAHRLHTIADYDTVIVLDAGGVVEQGSPRELLQHEGPDAVFRRLCEESGDFEKIKASMQG